MEVWELLRVLAEALTQSFMWLLSRASQICSSLFWRKGSRLDLQNKNLPQLLDSFCSKNQGGAARWYYYLTVPLNRTGSWGMMDSLLRRSASPMRLMSTPSIRMEPPQHSTSRNRATPKEDLPARRLR